MAHSAYVFKRNTCSLQAQMTNDGWDNLRITDDRNNTIGTYCGNQTGKRVLVVASYSVPVLTLFTSLEVRVRKNCARGLGYLIQSLFVFFCFLFFSFFYETKTSEQFLIRALIMSKFSVILTKCSE